MVLSGLTEVDEYLDEQVSQLYKDQPLAQDWARVSKALEEAGEAVAALIGMTGQNPRKGFTHGREDLLDELADLALTGIYAIQHFTKDADHTHQIVEIRHKKHYQRLGIAVDEPLDNHPDAVEARRWMGAMGTCSSCGTGHMVRITTMRSQCDSCGAESVQRGL